MKIKMWCVVCNICNNYIYFNAQEKETQCPHCCNEYNIKYRCFKFKTLNVTNKENTWTRLRFCRRKQIWIDEKIWKLACKKCKERYINPKKLKEPDPNMPHISMLCDNCGRTHPYWQVLFDKKDIYYECEYCKNSISYTEIKQQIAKLLSEGKIEKI